MKPFTPATLLALALTAAPGMALAQAPAAGPAAASTQTGDILFDSRLRYEGVSQDGLDDATAVTLRARLGWQSPAWSGFRLLVEGEGVVLELTGGDEEPLRPETLRRDPEGVLYASGRDGTWAIRLAPRAVLELESCLDEDAEGEVTFALGGQRFSIPEVADPLL